MGVRSTWATVKFHYPSNFIRVEILRRSPLSNKTKIIFLIIAGLILVAAGVFASFLLIERYQSDQAPAEAEVETVKAPVVVLTRDLSLGATIAESDVQLANVPVEIAPRNVVSTLEEAIGKMVKTDLVQGEMLLAHNLAEPTTNNKDLNYILSEDHVLMAFPATDLMSRESLVQRGDIVDIFATFDEEIKTPGQAPPTGEEVAKEEIDTRTFTVDTMQKISITAMVLDVIQGEGETATPLGGGNQEDGASSNASIKAYLLALDPQSALILKHLKDIGAIFDFVLRSPTSTVDHELTPVSEEYIIELYGLEIIP
jgi:Flp pilus assembly protein CpaB